MIIICAKIGLYLVYRNKKGGSFFASAPSYFPSKLLLDRQQVLSDAV